MYSQTMGTGVLSALSGSHSRALNCVPSFMPIHWFSLTWKEFFSGSRQVRSSAAARPPRIRATDPVDRKAAELKRMSRREILMSNLSDDEARTLLPAAGQLQLFFGR